MRGIFRAVLILVVAAAFTRGAQALAQCGGAWSFAASSGPSPRFNPAMAFDAATGKILLFGGADASNAPLGDTWEWDGSMWAPLAIAGPPARGGSSMVFDSVRNRIVLFGGYQSASVYFNDTWVFQNGAWAQLSTTGGPPEVRQSFAMAYDTARDRTVVVGGAVRYGVSSSVDVWELNGSTWANVYTRDHAQPAQRYGCGGAYDPISGTFVMFGGELNVGHATAETWAWDGSTWSLGSNAGEVRYAPSLAFDSDQHEVIRFGGENDTVWVGDTAALVGGAWAQLSTGGPSPRDYARIAYDPVRHETIVFGGRVGQAGGMNVVAGDTWRWRFAYAGIASQPVSARACSTGGTQFSVTGVGAGPLTYQWQVQTGPSVWQSLANDPAPFPCGGGASAYASPIDSPNVTIGIHPCPGSPTTPQHFQIRCVVTNACGSVTSNEATYTICPADFNCSGSLTINDIFDFLSAWFAGTPSADFNGANGIGIQDIFDFLAAWFAGC